MRAIDSKCRDNAAHIPGSIVETGDGPSIMRRGYFNEIQRRGSRRKCSEER